MSFYFLACACAALLGICVVLAYHIHELRDDMNHWRSVCHSWKNELDGQLYNQGQSLKRHTEALASYKDLMGDYKELADDRDSMHGRLSQMEELVEKLERALSERENLDRQTEAFLSGVNNIMNYDYNTARKAVSDDAEAE